MESKVAQAANVKETICFMEPVGTPGNGGIPDTEKKVHQTMPGATWSTERDLLACSEPKSGTGGHLEGSYPKCITQWGVPDNKGSGVR